ncbi:MAG: hypothetical protein ACLFV7_03145 [Phycisphaerae bacterium]
MPTFTHPWLLVGLLPVLGVALWALVRPGRQSAVVAWLGLWKEAAGSLPPASRRRIRRVSAAWACLLGGAVLAVLAAARPIVPAATPSRRVVVVVYPMADLGEQGMVALRRAAATYLNRLEPGDRVLLLFPPQVPTPAGEWGSPQQARKRIEALLPAPIAASQATRAPLPEGVDDAVHFAPASMPLHQGPGQAVVSLPADPPAVTLDALSAVSLDAGGVELFAALHNHTARAQTVEVRPWVLTAAGNAPTRGEPNTVTIPVGGRRGVAFRLATEAAVAGVSAGKGAAQNAFLVRRSSPGGDVVLLGRPDPNLRRFLNADPTLRLVTDPNEADAAIAVGTAPPPGLPAIVFDPPSAPVGWRKGEASGPLLLRRANLAEDDPLLQHVPLEAVAVRTARAWIASGQTPQVRLVTRNGDALVLRTSEDHAAPARVWVAFDPAAENTNLPVLPAMPIFLRNVMDYLLPATQHKTRYLGGLGLPPAEDARSVWMAPGRWMGGRAPGLYLDRQGEYVAANVLGLRGGRANAEPAAAAESLTLPAAGSRGEPTDLLAVLAVAAGAAWLVGWWLRLRA